MFKYFLVFDSWAKFPAGILEGNLYEFGNFDECIAIKHETANRDIGVIQGHYCIPPAMIDLSNFGNSTP